jgi:carboxypeptidase family protein
MNNRFGMQWVIAGIMVLSLLFATAARADELYGRVRGAVTDSTGAAMPGVQVKLTNVGTGIVKEMTSGSDGSYLFVDLIPGTYSLVATKSGFRVYQARGITVLANQIFVQNVAMEVGAVSERVEVTANPVQVESTSMQLGATLSGDDILQLPSLNRNWIGLQQTMPGVVTPDTRFGNNYSTNGSQAQQNSYLVNGNDANDLPLNSPLVVPSPDAIQEVQMVTDTINPEFGRNSGAIMNALTKSGTNGFHGSAFEFYRDTFLNTANYFQIAGGKKQVPALHQNQFGGTVGGPIWKNKLFFFYSLQITRARTPQAVATQSVYTQAMLGGDYTGIFGDPATCNPSTQTCLSSNSIPGTMSNINGAGGVCPGAQTWVACFPNRQIPTSIFNSESTQLISTLVPQPNTTGNAGENGFTWDPITLVKTNQHLGRLDFTPTSKDSIWFSAFANDTSNLNDLPFTGSTLPGFGDSSLPYTKMFTAAWAHTFSPTILNELRLGYTRLNFPTGQPQHVRLPSSFGFTNIIPQAPAQSDMTQIALTGYFTLGGTTNGPQPRKDQTYQLTDNFSWTFGKHALKFGYDGRKFQVWNPFLADNNGVYSFDPSGTYSTGDPSLDFLLGIPQAYAQETGSYIIAQAYEHYFYFQDQWRIKNNLTLTLGTGYQIDTPIEEFQNNGLSRVCFQPAVQSVVFPTAPIGYTLPGDPGCNKYGGPTTKLNHFGPRVGFAWSPDFGALTGGAGKTSLRGGFGVYYNRSEEEMNLQDLGIPPFGLSTIGASSPSFPDPFTDLNAGTSIPNPFPYSPPGPGTTNIDFSQFYPLGFALSTNARNLTVPHAFNWNLTLERQLPAQTIVKLGYVGSHGSNLITSYTANPATPAGVQTCLADPNNTINGGTGTNPVTGFPACVDGRAYQPIFYPDHYQYEGDIWANFGQQTNGGWSNYNSLQFVVDKHMTHGLEFNSAYTWSHSLDVSSSFEDTAFQATGGVDSYGNFQRDYGSSAYDARQRWVISWVYQVPEPKNWGSVAKRALGGWTFTGDNAFQSGFPINFQDTSIRSLNCTYAVSFYGCSDRPDVVSTPKALDPHSAVFGTGCPSAATCKNDYYFDPSSFAHNAYGTEGSTPRGYFTGPGLWNADATLSKITTITEGKTLQLRIDFFNIFNHTNFANPSGNRNSSNFGRILSIRNVTNSRLIQLGARFEF